MIKTATIIEVGTDENAVCLFDTVTVFIEEDNCEETYRIVTTMRAEVFDNRISCESPAGKALLGHKVGDRVLIQVNDNYSYYVLIKKIVKGKDDDSLELR